MVLIDILWCLAICYVALFLQTKRPWLKPSLLAGTLVSCFIYSAASPTTLSWLIENRPFIALSFLFLAISVCLYAFTVSTTASTVAGDSDPF